MPDTADDHDDAIAFIHSIENDLMAVLQHRTQLLDQTTGEPRFSSHVQIHTLIDLLGHVMRDAIAREGEPVRAVCHTLIDRLHLYLAPSSARPN